MSTTDSGKTTPTTSDDEWERLKKSLLDFTYTGGLIECFIRMLNLRDNQQGHEDVARLIEEMANKLVPIWANSVEELSFKAAGAESYMAYLKKEKGVGDSGFTNETVASEKELCFMRWITGLLHEETQKNTTLGGIYRYLHNVHVRLTCSGEKTKEHILQCLTLSLPEGQKDVILCVI